MHRSELVAEALRLRAEEGLGARRVAKRLGLPLATVRDWHAGRLPRSFDSTDDSAVGCERCGAALHRPELAARSCVYVLGLYLGDGNLSEGRRGVVRLRVTLDRRYPAIIREAEAALGALPEIRRVGRVERRDNCVDVSAYSKALPCLLPQDGPGPKHQRRIWLRDWQRRLATSEPRALLRGLIHSDGSRSINTGRGGWRHPRYSFTNRSTDITSIFCSACDVLGLRWTASFPAKDTSAVSIYVSRKADVAAMDEFVGPKA